MIKEQFSFKEGTDFYQFSIHSELKAVFGSYYWLFIYFLQLFNIFFN